jgi:hypothetical protein
MLKKLLITVLLLLPSAAMAFPFGNDTSVSFVPTVQNAAYANGNAMGGLQSVSVFQNASNPTGIFTGFSIYSQGGSTTAMTIYIFNANPSASTCTDKSAFVLNSADVSKLAMNPFVLTPGVVGSGTTVTSAQLLQTLSLSNRDATPGTKLYVCIVANGAVTPASTTDLVVTLFGALD